jgi:hypothetical protein
VEVYSPKPTKTKRKITKKISKIQESKEMDVSQIDTSNGFLFEITGHFMNESFVIENQEIEESVEDENSLFLDMSQDGN